MEKQAAEKAARRFLRTGTTAQLGADELAAACDRLVQQVACRSLKAALKIARQFVERSRPHGGVLELTAWRLLARTTHMSGDHAEALGAYRKARLLARQDRLVCARIDRALADVYMYMGRFRDSEQAAKRAIAAFSRVGADNDLAKARVNYGNLLHRRDRHREAERIYREAVAHFEKTDNKVALARCYYNLANSLVQLFHMDEAEPLYKRAVNLWEETGFELDACDARYGLAWHHMLTGQLHTALTELRACETVYQKAGDPRGQALCMLDRAEVCLHLGLSADALASAREAENRFTKLGLRYERSKASLFRSQSALAMGHRAEARRSVRTARDGFLKDRNDGFLGVALMTEMDVASHDNLVAYKNLQSARGYFKRSQLPLWQAVSDLKEAASVPRPKPALRRLAANRAAHHVPHIYAMWQVLQGDAEYREGRYARARTCWQKAADRLDAVRAQLPPVELRTSYSRKQNSPHARLVSFELTRNPVQAAIWSERQKTAGIWMPATVEGMNSPERLAVEESLHSLAGQFGALAHQVTAAGSERGQAPQADNSTVVRLQRKIREQLIRLEGDGASHLDSNEWLRDEINTHSHHRPIVQFHLTAFDIVAFVHHAGETRPVTLSGGRTRLIAALERWRFVLEAELLPGYPGQAERQQLEESLWQELGEWLWQPLRIRPEQQTIVIVPEGELANLPWEALRIGDQALGALHRFVITPSIRHYAAARRRYADSQAIEVFRGAGNNLPHVDSELQALVNMAGNRASMHASATRNDWPSTGGSNVWHFSGHALMNEHNPFYSSLVLNDGPIFAVDFRMKRCRVNLATLAACRSGEQVALPGEESTGLVRSLLEMGARNVIAGRWPVSDQTAAIWMKSFYQQFFAGSDILSAARVAALKVKDTFPSAFHWAAFAVFGAGDIGGVNETR